MKTGRLPQKVVLIRAPILKHGVPHSLPCFWNNTCPLILAARCSLGTQGHLFHPTTTYQNSRPRRSQPISEVIS
jgi:hypothetical protein